MFLLAKCGIGASSGRRAHAFGIHNAIEFDQPFQGGHALVGVETDLRVALIGHFASEPLQLHFKLLEEASASHWAPSPAQHQRPAFLDLLDALGRGQVFPIRGRWTLRIHAGLFQETLPIDRQRRMAENGDAPGEPGDLGALDVGGVIVVQGVPSPLVATRPAA